MEEIARLKLQSSQEHARTVGALAENAQIHNRVARAELMHEEGDQPADRNRRQGADEAGRRAMEDRRRYRSKARDDDRAAGRAGHHRDRDQPQHIRPNAARGEEHQRIAQRGGEDL